VIRAVRPLFIPRVWRRGPRKGNGAADGTAPDRGSTGGIVPHLRRAGITYKDFKSARVPRYKMNTTCWIAQGQMDGTGAYLE